MPSDDPRRNPGDIPPTRRPPADTPSHDDRGEPRRAPGNPDAPPSIEAPPSREPGPPPADGGRTDMPVTEHEGATEEQVGDREGPGVGYDEETAR
jgi:hypothetical protein